MASRIAAPSTSPSSSVMVVCATSCAAIPPSAPARFSISTVWSDASQMLADQALLLRASRWLYSHELFELSHGYLSA
jgi:hypothetical protein